jgi:hypothetical protein
MACSQISVEFYAPEEPEPTHRAFYFWQSALDYVRTLKPLPAGHLRVFVPGSLANDTRENELREALGLPPQY